MCCLISYYYFIYLFFSTDFSLFLTRKQHPGQALKCPKNRRTLFRTAKIRFFFQTHNYKKEYSERAQEQGCYGTKKCVEFVEFVDFLFAGGGKKNGRRLLSYRAKNGANHNQLLSTRSLLLRFPYGYILTSAWCRLGGSYKSGQSGQSGHIFLAEHMFYIPLTRYINLLLIYYPSYILPSSFFVLSAKLINIKQSYKFYVIFLPSSLFVSSAKLININQSHKFYVEFVEFVDYFLTPIISADVSPNHPQDRWTAV